MRADIKIKMIEQEYSRTESGKSWKKAPDSVTEEIITRAYYENMTSEGTLRFFRRLGGAETVSKGYTSQGYIVCGLSSCNPDRTIKKVRRFDILNEDGTVAR